MSYTQALWNLTFINGGAEHDSLKTEVKHKFRLFSMYMIRPTLYDGIQKMLFHYLFDFIINLKENINNIPQVHTSYAFSLGKCYSNVWKR